MEIKFTNHARERLKKRGISEEDVIETVNNAENTNKRGGKYYAQKNIGRGKIEVVYEKDKYIKIVTIYWIR